MMAMASFSLTMVVVWRVVVEESGGEGWSLREMWTGGGEG